jgi:hypothetical protein
LNFLLLQDTVLAQLKHRIYASLLLKVTRTAIGQLLSMILRISALRFWHVIKKVSMVQIAKEIQKMTDGQINNYI